MEGQRIQTGKVNDNIIDVSNLNAGIYIVQFFDEGNA